MLVLAALGAGLLIGGLRYIVGRIGRFRYLGHRVMLCLAVLIFLVSLALVLLQGGMFGRKAESD